MLLFATCNNKRTAQCNNQRRKYTKVEYSKYAKEDMRAHRRWRTHRQRHVHCQRQVHWVRQRRHVRSWGWVQRVPLRGCICSEKQRRASFHKNKWPRTSCKATISRIRAAYAVQGNTKPLTTIDEWATTFDNCEGTKAPMVRLIAPIDHHNEAPIAPLLKRVCLWPPPQHMHGSKTFVLSWQEATLGCTVGQSMLLIAEPHITEQNVKIVLMISTTLGKCPSAMRQTPG